MKKPGEILLSLIFIMFININGINAIDSNVSLEKGKIIDSVRCNANPKYSYALYLPKNYSEKVIWPIIYIFDPAARGKSALSGFIAAAERYGYIAVCSNDSKNSLSTEVLEEAINNLFKDTKARFSIDSRRIYTSGFSGGSRVAAIIALNYGNISGVIACGAGFPNYTDIKNIPSFDYFGIVGNRDMNYMEMCDLVENLENRGKTVELRIFNGGHVWPSSALLEEAIEWMELKAMNKGIKNKNPDFINTMFERYYTKAVSLSEQGKLMEAVSNYKYIIKDFPDHIAALKVKSRLDSLLITKSYLKSLKTWNNNRSWELEKQNTLIEVFSTQVRNEELSDSNRIWWAGQIKMLRLMETGKDTTKQIIVSRILMLINTLFYESGRNYLNYKKFGAASVCYQLESIIDPENKNIYYTLAKIYSLTNKKEESIRSLEKAIKMGYSNRPSIEKDSAFISLKNEKRYKEIMMKLK